MSGFGLGLASNKMSGNTAPCFVCDFLFREDYRCQPVPWPRLSGVAAFVYLHALIGRIPRFGFQVSGFSYRVSDFGFQVSGFRFRASGFGFRVSGFGFRSRFRVLGCSCRVLGLGVSSVGCRFSGFGCRFQGAVLESNIVGFVFQDSCSLCRISGLGIRAYSESEEFRVWS